ncbi:2-polyprenyl-6-methoxyphenol hydroxylase-like FAD-dependent oxidoreductase [Paraburkholderia sp. WSM4177]|nr:2-polyprenyl-6-methoxyphenol hydroxylase-like FAD-dependent oxidoreductase [Paraburkholderia sp. WSM4177]MBB5485084.1 2-polyprenyl-6-methoxyphenol hydroxylase-like FAD-dependent oxidoreductase [Paraburkholderia sp. WSM4180]
METAAKDGAAPSSQNGRVRPHGRPHVVRARYLVGADGASSLVGQQLKGKTFAEDWLIVDARHVPRPVDHIEFICDHRRPTPRMVAPDGRERWEFMLGPGERREDMKSETLIRELLSPWGNVDDMINERKAVYRFHARTVDAFSNGRVFLAGDAANITPPFVGQGLVAGLRDAAPCEGNDQPRKVHGQARHAAKRRRRAPDSWIDARPSGHRREPYRAGESCVAV